MKKVYLIISFTILLLIVACRGVEYTYESVQDDPLQVRIYTLENGLKVYLSVNKDKPRVQTYIGVRVGAKNDPKETTGLAHYFEHLMFKGTQHFGTSDYQAEKPLLDRIEALFEAYRTTTGQEERKALYAQIDSLSQEASRFAIPNEYDKLMTSIGARGTNAFTSYDVTAYTENIPANEIENWAIIQSDRFTNPVIRGFHTELETVYEEYNMSLTRDARKVYQAILSGLFPHHPYGTQTVLGTQEHLKNPSITNIRRYFETWYVPNNMAVCMAGDFDPDEVIAIIDRHFGKLKPKALPALETRTEETLPSPLVREVTGLEAENVAVAFRLPAANTREAAILELADYLLTNGKAGLIDLNLVQKQRVLRAGSYSAPMADYSLFVMNGTPKEGQTLDEVRDLLLEQLAMLRRGDFEESLLEAVINNFRLERYHQSEDSDYAAYLLLNAFINDIRWEDAVNKINVQAALTKQDIVDFCRQYLNENYLVVYKREGTTDDSRIEKPAITPIPTNRDEESKFLARIKSRNVKPVEPVFTDFERDLTVTEVKKDLRLLYKQNTTNPLFSLVYIYEMGNNHDRLLGTAFNYLNYLGTPDYTAEEIKSELYRLACTFSVTASDERVYVSISGLSDNFEQAMYLLEDRLSHALADPEIYRNYVRDILKQREDAKLNQQTNFSRLTHYAVWGETSPATNVPSEAELKALDPESLTRRIRGLQAYQHTAMYYGPLEVEDAFYNIRKNHCNEQALVPPPAPHGFTEQESAENLVLLAHYDAAQTYLAMIHRGEAFDRDMEATRTMYNAYFGGGMNSIVFQEMREARGLAYSAWASYQRPAKPDRSYIMQAFIATQNDKMQQAVETFRNILNDMPLSEKAFDLSREGLLTNIRTQRQLRSDVLWSYLDACEFGYAADPRRELFARIPVMTLDEVRAFQEQYVRNRPYTFCILGDTAALDMTVLEGIGRVKRLSREEIFGY